MGKCIVPWAGRGGDEVLGYIEYDSSPLSRELTADILLSLYDKILGLSLNLKKCRGCDATIAIVTKIAGHN